MILNVAKLMIKSRMSKGLIISQLIMIIYGVFYRVLYFFFMPHRSAVASALFPIFLIIVILMFLASPSLAVWLSPFNRIEESDVQYLFLMPISERTLALGVILGASGFTLFNTGLEIVVLGFIMLIPIIGILITLLLLLIGFFLPLAFRNKRRIRKYFTFEDLFFFSFLALLIYSLIKPDSPLSIIEASFNIDIGLIYLSVLMAILLVFITMYYKNVILLYATFYEPSYRKVKEKKEEEVVFTGLTSEKAIFLKAFRYAFFSAYRDIVSKITTKRFILGTSITSIIFLIMYFIWGTIPTGIITSLALMILASWYTGGSVFTYEPLWLSFGIMNPAKFARLYIAGRVLSFTLILLPFVILFPFFGWEASVLLLEQEILAIISVIVFLGIQGILNPRSVMGYRRVGYQMTTKRILNGFLLQFLGFVAMGLPFLSVFVYLTSLMKPPFAIIFTKLPHTTSNVQSFLNYITYIGFHPQILFTMEVIGNLMLIAIFSIVAVIVLFSESFWYKVVENMTEAGIP